MLPILIILLNFVLSENEMDVEMMKVIFTVYLAQNLLSIIIGLKTKVQHSIMKSTIVYWLAQFMMFEGILILIGSIIICRASPELDVTHFYMFLALQLIELMRLIFCFFKTRELLRLTTGKKLEESIIVRIFRIKEYERQL